MKTTLMTVLATLVLTSSAYANCTLSQITGAWKQDRKPHSEALWRFSSDRAENDYNVFDQYGMYFQYTSVYATSLDEKTCVLTARGIHAISKSLRNANDPAPNGSSEQSMTVGTRYLKVTFPTADTMSLGECLNAQCGVVVNDITVTR